MNSIASLLIAYLLGSIPTAVWTSKIWKKTDIRLHGSKNAGLTNVVRVLGWKPAIPVMIVDLSKGVLAPYIAMKLAPEVSWLPLLAGVFVILGHSFTLFAGFRGGKGVLTAMGVFLMLSPVVALICFAIWSSTVKLSGYVSVASILGCLALGFLLTFGIVVDGSFVGPVSPGLLIMGWSVAAFVIIKHRTNIVRLWHGTENRFGQKAKAKENAA